MPEIKKIEVVCAIIKDDKGRIFCTQRGKGRALAGYWEFPGGKVEKNETHEQTIIREIKEELDSEIEPIKFLIKIEHTYDDFADGFKGFHITMYAYLCKLIKGNLTLKEHMASTFVYPKDLKNLDFAKADEPIIDFLIRGDY